jgi:hypothetical protein
LIGGNQRKSVNLADFIEKLQKKPRHIKIQIMWVCAIICTVFIFSIWVWSLGNDIKQTGQVSTSNNQIDTEKLLSGFSQMKEDIPTLWQSLGAGISNVFDSVQENNQEVLKSEPQTEKIEKLPVE